MAAGNADVLMPFASTDPDKGRLRAGDVRRLVREFGAKGVQVPPDDPGFASQRPNGLSAVTGDCRRWGDLPVSHRATGVGSSMRGGNVMRLKHSNPMYRDGVTVDFPDTPIVLAHRSFAWLEEALAVVQKKKCLHILVGMVAEVFPPDSDLQSQCDPEEKIAVLVRLAGDCSGKVAGGV